MLELSWGGKNALKLSNGEERTFINDGDTVTLAGYCQSKDGYRYLLKFMSYNLFFYRYKIGFGESSSKVKPALPLEYFY